MKIFILLVACVFFCGCSPNAGPATYAYFRSFRAVVADYKSEKDAISRPAAPQLSIDRSVPPKVRFAQQKAYEKALAQYVAEELQFLQKEEGVVVSTQGKLGALNSRGADKNLVRAVQIYSAVLGDRHRVFIEMRDVMSYSNSVEQGRRSEGQKVFVSTALAALSGGPGPAAIAFLKSIGENVQAKSEEDTELRQRLIRLRDLMISMQSKQSDFWTFLSQMMSDLKNRFPDEKWEELTPEEDKPS